MVSTLFPCCHPQNERYSVLKVYPVFEQLLSAISIFLRHFNTYFAREVLWMKNKWTENKNTNLIAWKLLVVICFENNYFRWLIYDWMYSWFQPCKNLKMSKIVPISIQTDLHQASSFHWSQHDTMVRIHNYDWLIFD